MAGTTTREELEQEKQEELNKLKMNKALKSVRDKSSMWMGLWLSRGATRKTTVAVVFFGGLLFGLLSSSAEG